MKKKVTLEVDNKIIVVALIVGMIVMVLSAYIQYNRLDDKYKHHENTEISTEIDAESN